MAGRIVGALSSGPVPEASSLNNEIKLLHKDRLCRLRTSDITCSITSSMFSIRAPNCVEVKQRTIREYLEL